MSVSSFTRQYVMLRPVGCHAHGFARLEVCGGKGCVTLQASCLPQQQSLRALLLSGLAASCCVLDLGVMTVNASHAGTLLKEGLPLPALRGYDAILLTTDWPDPQIRLYGMLHQPARCTLWQMEEALQRYLSVPCTDMSPAQPLPLPSDEVPQTSCSNHAVLPSVQPHADGLPETSLLRLKPLDWPEHLLSLREYFDQLRPCAPFPAPGWRFVRVPLAAGSPASYGVVGIHIHRHAVDRVAYALPGSQRMLPPGGLQGYSWQQGQDGQGYWLMIQEAQAVTG